MNLLSVFASIFEKILEPIKSPMNRKGRACKKLMTTSLLIESFKRCPMTVNIPAKNMYVAMTSLVSFLVKDLFEEEYRPTIGPWMFNIAFEKPATTPTAVLLEALALIKARFLKSPYIE